MQAQYLRTWSQTNRTGSQAKNIQRLQILSEMAQDLMKILGGINWEETRENGADLLLQSRKVWNKSDGTGASNNNHSYLQKMATNQVPC